MSGLLSIAISKQDGQTLITVEGELDVSTVDKLRGPLLEQVAGEPGVRLDLSGLAFMDSSGLHLLLDATRTAQERDHRFSIVRPSRAVLKVLDLTGMRDELPIAGEAAAEDD